MIFNQEDHTHSDDGSVRFLLCILNMGWSAYWAIPTGKETYQKTITDKSVDLQCANAIWLEEKVCLGGFTTQSCSNPASKSASQCFCPVLLGTLVVACSAAYFILGKAQQCRRKNPSAYQTALPKSKRA